MDQVIASLNTLEFNDLVTVYDVALVMQKIEMVMRVTNIIEKYVIELGDEGTLVSMQLEELMGTTYFDLDQVFKDYNISEDEISTFKENIKKLSSEDLIDLTKIAKLLGYKDTSENMDMQIRSKGYRILSKIHRLPNTIVDNLACYFENFQSVLCASLDTLCDVDGVGEIRAKHIKNELVKMQQLVLLDKKI